MTKTTKTSSAKTTAANPDAAATGDAKTIIMNAVENLHDTIAVPEAAREFVAQQAAKVQEHTEATREGVAEFNAQAEKSAVSFIASYTDFTKTLFDMTAANVRDSFAAMEKLAAAKSLPDALKLQSEFVRDNSKANFERFMQVSQTAGNAITHSTATAREAAAKAWSNASKAA
ncbi:phasin family protein [Hoeflea sp. YIM 152468]|uniref:phasin family protein n=1 Tax=Hoeflea sp. YIM 152468 TaxID=3031759 RepID=UPI0023DB3442|nr:phasin family protein [Hoeflea sp. YIM 152468]MDF1607808.1 phasin family protein [Hoeflea sp. YIM 152468]